MREPGYYWVKLQPTDKEMHVAKWTGKYWLLHGETFRVGDQSFHQIDSNRLSKSSRPNAVKAILKPDFDGIDVMFAVLVTAILVVLFSFIFS